MTDTADVIVLGMGVGGELLAEHVAGAGLDVIGIEANLVGGECPYWGCIPTKMMARAANALAEARRGPHLARPPARHPHLAPAATRLPVGAAASRDDRAPPQRLHGQGGRVLGG